MRGILNVFLNLGGKFFVFEHRVDVVDEAHSPNYYLSWHCIVHWKTGGTYTWSTKLIQSLQFIVPGQLFEVYFIFGLPESFQSNEALHLNFDAVLICIFLEENTYCVLIHMVEMLLFLNLVQIVITASIDKKYADYLPFWVIKHYWIFHTLNLATVLLFGCQLVFKD